MTTCTRRSEDSRVDSEGCRHKPEDMCRIVLNRLAGAAVVRLSLMAHLLSRTTCPALPAFSHGPIEAAVRAQETLASFQDGQAILATHG